MNENPTQLQKKKANRNPSKVNKLEKNQLNTIKVILKNNHLTD